MRISDVDDPKAMTKMDCLPAFVESYATQPFAVKLELVHVASAQS